MHRWLDIAWAEERVEEVLTLLAREAGIPTRTSTGREGAALTRLPAGADRIGLAADTLGLEAESVSCTYSEVLGTLRRIGPGLIRVSDRESPRLLAVIRCDADAAVILTPAGSRVRVPYGPLVARLTAPLEGGPGKRVDQWLARMQLSPRRAVRARDHLLRHVIGGRRLEGLWILRGHASTSFLRELHHHGASRRVLFFSGAAIVQILLSVGGWILLGRGALDGVVQTGWLVAWVLVVLSGVGAQLVSSWSAGQLAIDIGVQLKRRLLTGALCIEADEIVHRGSGALLATVAESATVERSGFSGVVGTLTSAIQLIAAALVLSVGAGGRPHALLLVAFVAAIIAGNLYTARRRARWSAQRFAMTNDFVEKVIGNRTRVVQQAPEDWHIEEDRALESYMAASEHLDHAQHLLARLPSRAWFGIGMLGILPALLWGQDDRAAIAISVVGILQAQGGLVSLSGALSDLMAALVAWRGISPLFEAATLADPAASPAAVALTRSAPVNAQVPILEAQGLTFSYPTLGNATITECDLVLRDGDRILLEGASGSGKSTLVSLLSGLELPTSGLLLLRGFDRSTLGGLGWKRSVSSAPQFHKNHVFANTLAFNLLMGRSWPPAEGDLKKAETICRELGLGPLLDRMPSRLDQVVGETGWQLSHGERSRIFLARALLQDAEVVFLDETFGALDPLTMQTCMDCAKRHARTLVIVGHH
ncbi:ATP-binding cassette domain-containing protein [Pendulispora brunnea]|uniref:ATP-binding cassette domain-containing protein n=1 Tax=Pendulispora brunnea TaxID=2905690 RepID=A0ABZ2KKE4_9BACT